MAMTGIRRVLLHGSRDESFDQSVRFAGQLVEGFGAELHVVYTIDEPLSAGWTAETTPDKLPELHQAMEEEAREAILIAETEVRKQTRSGTTEFKSNAVRVDGGCL